MWLNGRMTTSLIAHALAKQQSRSESRGFAAIQVIAYRWAVLLEGGAVSPSSSPRGGTQKRPPVGS